MRAAQRARFQARCCRVHRGSSRPSTTACATCASHATASTQIISRHSAATMRLRRPPLASHRRRRVLQRRGMGLHCAGLCSWLQCSGCVNSLRCWAADTCTRTRGVTPAHPSLLLLFAAAYVLSLCCRSSTDVMTPTYARDASAQHCESFDHSSCSDEPRLLVRSDFWFIFHQPLHFGAD